MSTHRHIDRICCIVLAAVVLVTVLFMNGSSLGIQASERVLGYENRLFSSGSVHTIDIVMDDWDSFIETCENEEYAVCTLVIDGETFKNVGIRAKGNTSLSSVSQMNSDRYSFKVEFDQYDSTKSYYGLDKLSLNNLIQDNTFMKDYLTYTLMWKFGVASPLCSYVYITVNGEDWGLYLAAEGIEDSFLNRNYGSGSGELYKPDSMSFGAGRGNGKDFDMGNFTSDSSAEDAQSEGGSSGMQMPQDGAVPEGFGMPQDGTMPEGFEMPQDGTMPEGFGVPQDGTMPEGFEMPQDGGFGMGAMGSDDVKLKYMGDDPDSYSNIFDNAKTDITQADQMRLIESLKALSEGTDIESVVNIEAVIRYFVVHNFVVNGDSYTGSMIHNYYLYEQDGVLEMLPWDYNLAFGTFQGLSASDAVNDPIDSPLSSGSDRPMLAWIFENEEYTQLYHSLFSEFIAQYLESGYVEQLISDTAEMLAPYVERDPTAFCTYEEFESGVTALGKFCTLRAQSVRGQLDGSIPSTDTAQKADGSALVDASSLSLSDMGTMSDTMGGGMPGGMSGGRGTQSQAMPGQDRTMPEQMQSETMQFPTQGGTQILQNGFIPIGISCVILIAALIFALKFKRR